MPAYLDKSGKHILHGMPNKLGLTYDKVSILSDNQALLPTKNYQFAASPIHKLQPLPFKNIRIKKDPKRDLTPTPPRQRVN